MGVEEMITCDACGEEVLVVLPYQGKKFKLCDECMRMAIIMDREVECGTGRACVRGNS